MSHPTPDSALQELQTARAELRAARRIIVKVGSALVTRNGTCLDRDAMADWARQISELRAAGKAVLLVSSGAIAAGMQRLGWSKRPHAMDQLQAAAAIGQMGLVQAYEEAFSHYNLAAAQILVTHDDLSDRKRYLNARSTILALLELGVVPIINENDTIVTDEIKFGDNDTLGALIANLIEADALIILTDQKGLYTADPRSHPDATLITAGRAEDPAYAAMAGGAGTGIARGGMITKVRAARRAAGSGAHTYIVAGAEPDALLRIVQGEELGTLLYATTPPRTARKQWLVDHLQLAGAVVLDEGAVKALKSGRSLLPIGITEVRSNFERGAAIACLDADGNEIARGLVNYASTECRRIMRKSSHDIREILGYDYGPEVVHRDNLVVTG